MHFLLMTLLFFCKADKKEAQVLRYLLELYERGLGQLINLDKSSVLFSKNFQAKEKEEISLHLGGIARVDQGKYLGLPMVVNKTKCHIFSFIKEKVKARLGSWKNKMLSLAGKEVMLKAVCMAMPIHAMSCFKLPTTLCKKLLL